jgi:HD-GYP domain-containing protein (c-di-GMP phosphodiesterase class II)
MQQKIVFGSIKALLTLLNTRVPWEYTHSPQFSKLVCALGCEIALGEKQIESLKYACLLHETVKSTSFRDPYQDDDAYRRGYMILLKGIR